MNSEEYTSLVMRARPMATTGGSSDHSEPTAWLIGAWIMQPIRNATMNNPVIILPMYFFMELLPF